MSSNCTIAHRTDFDRLARPLAAWNPRRWYFESMRKALRAVAGISEGVGVGERHGYDSGVMLEYVYRNEARGKNWLGRAVDRAFLDSPGWRGIRDRGDLIKAALGAELDAAALAGREIHLLDVACGGGRYALETLRAHPGKAKSALLRDYRAENIESARALARELGVDARFEQADAFNDRDLDRIAPAPNLILVSGLHEIIADNRVVERHFEQIARIAARPATLIFTIQPWHPQVEFIARVLKSHTGAPWVMRLRPWEQTQAWAEAAGFKVRAKTMERQGIFGVVVADLS